MERTQTGGIADLLDMIKFPHTIFALPFAFTGMLLAAKGFPTLPVIGWIVLAMVGARTAAMTWNRIADRDIDAKNPRTASRHLPAGKVGLAQAWAMLVAGTALMLIAAWKLNFLCLALSPIALGAVFLYPYAKRFTSLCHYLLGFCLAAAPLGAWVAVTGEWSWRIVPLGVAVMIWTAGFDVLYALQDLDFDKKEGLHSLPCRLGVPRSLLLARVLHAGMFLLLVAQIPLFGMGLWYSLGLIPIGAFLVYEHSLVSARDLSRLNAAFFTMNGIVSVAVFVATLIDVLARKP
jgi:4-hydroxybenzoate polyprenyltransferase